MSKTFIGDPAVDAMLGEFELCENEQILKGFSQAVGIVQQTLVRFMNAPSENWSLYIIEASDASLYTGITTDVERRFDEHLNCQKGAKYFNGRRPLRVVYREEGHTRSSASRREAEIKKLTRSEKQNLINN